jgi:hypothetical protein
MSDQIDIDGANLGDLIAEYFRANGVPPSFEDWTEMLVSLRSLVFSGHPAEKVYWVDLYRRRQETAIASGSRLADELGRVVRELSASEESSMVLVIVDRGGYGCLIWLSPDLSSVLPCLG